MPEPLTAALVLLLHVVLAISGAGHALVYKRDPRAAFGWIGMCLVFPLIGPLLYFLFGVNRVQTRARRLTRLAPFRLGVGYERGARTSPRAVVQVRQFEDPWAALATASNALARRPLVEGNHVRPLHNGEAAYPEMLAAIDRAETRIVLATYIFETNRTGHQFIDALTRAQRRGVDVRVLIDGLGEFYSLPRAGRLLRKAGVRTERFMEPRLLPPSLDINLRNHRKILAVDGIDAFVGGMNIGDRHLVGPGGGGRSPVVDLHFGLQGPVVDQIETVFAEDWHFTTGEVIEPVRAAVSRATGPALCRAFTDGPNEDLDTLALVLHGAASVARERIDIMTPYFIPPAGLVTALQAAALRGVQVRIVLPAKNNLPYVHWATRNMLGELLAFGVDVRYQPPPFVHTKLFLVDGHYAIIGSPNLDPRSLRLNFELAVEIFCSETVAGLEAHCDQVAQVSRRVTLEEVDDRPLAVRVRDATCWLFSPYL